MQSSYSFPTITLLVTHYNRSSSLERLLKSFQDLNCSFGDIVVSDDGSKNEHITILKELSSTYSFRLITTPKNKGLGNNINKGQDAVTTPLTLYVQEDFIPQPIFPGKLQNALTFMQERQELDMARFYAYFKYPYLKPLAHGFSEMLFPILSAGYKKFYQYSDHPHLRRTSFLEKFGRYPEGVKGDLTEYIMMMRFLQRKGKSIYFDKFNDLFEQKNSSDEPSTMKRDFWRESENPFVTLARHCYRYGKFYTDYLFKKF